MSAFFCNFNFLLSPTFLLAKNFRSMMYSGISDITATVTCHGYWRMALMISLNSMISPFFASYQEAVLNTFPVLPSLMRSDHGKEYGLCILYYRKTRDYLAIKNNCKRFHILGISICTFHKSITTIQNKIPGLFVLKSCKIQHFWKNYIHTNHV